MENKNTVQQNFNVLGMSCAACATRVEKTLNRQPGVSKAVVNYAAATVHVEYDKHDCTPEQLRHAVQDAGYDLVTNDEPETETEKIRARNYRRLQINTAGAVTLALPVLIISFFGNSLPHSGLVMCLLATPVVFGFGNSFFRNAWKQLRHGAANMDTLVASSTGIAYFFSLFNLLFPDFWLTRGIEPHVYFEASSVIIAFILLGRLLEERAKSKTSVAIKKLMGLSPKYIIRILSDGRQETVAVSQVHVGDLLMVKPGERIAVDGTLVDGSSYVDESMLSGEPIATGKQAGDKVYAGTLNQKGTFRFKADKVGSNTMLANIIRMVQEAQGSKAPVQKTVDKIAAVFVPAIMGIALLSFILWWLLAPENGFTYGILAAVTVLVIACPCALGLATPTALMVGIGKAAENGILIKNAESIETAQNIDTIVMDKTGTLTEGKPVVNHTVWNTDCEKDYSIFLCNLERRSEHPLADAITVHYTSLPDLPVDKFENISGMGVKGCIDGKEYYAGSRKLLSDRGIQVSSYLETKAMQLEVEAQSMVWFSDNHEAIGFVAITDRIKENSAKAVELLQKVQHLTLYMLTGDNEKTATAIAAQTGLKNIRASMLPQDKAAFVRQLQHDGHKVAMVGDGINDSAALSQADLSIAMGTGSDIAMDTADMTIISSDLTKISEALDISALTVRTIKQNLFWAFFYNLVSIPIAAGILYPVNGFLLNPMIAGAAMAFSSVSVVTNSLRLRRKKMKTAKDADIQSHNNKNDKIMKKTFHVKGMMCQHCCAHVEKALNSIPGVHATVTLEPPVAVVEFDGNEKTLDELQNAVTENAGEYTLTAE